MSTNESKIDANKLAWSKIAKDHYEHFKVKLCEVDFKINPIVEKELGDISGKKILHLQCNTGADSILLARNGAIVTGVDLVPENIYYARKLSTELGLNNIQFIESDILKLSQIHNDEYDIVLTTDGVLGWLPDLEQWGKVIGKFLKKDGFFYLHDSHPFIMIFDETGLKAGKLIPKYPYFNNPGGMGSSIGGYASKPKEAVIYYWEHQISDIINGLLSGNLFVTYIKEYDRCVSGMGGSVVDENGLCYYPEFDGQLPLMLSLKAEKK